MGQKDLYQSDFYEDKSRFADVFNGVLFAGREVMKAGIKFVGDEYPSEMKKGQKFTPIITLVLYLGKDKIWDGERSLYGLLDLEDELKPFVNDFKLNLFDYHEYKNFEMFKTANRFLFEALSCGKDLKKMRRMLKENLNYKELDELTVKAIAGILKLKVNLEKIAKVKEEGKEVYDMCQTFEDYKEEGRREGIRKGKREGRREGEVLALRTAVNNLMKNQKITFETAAEMLGISKSTQKKAVIIENIGSQYFFKFVLLSTVQYP